MNIFEQVAKQQAAEIRQRGKELRYRKWCKAVHGNVRRSIMKDYKRGYPIRWIAKVFNQPEGMVRLHCKGLK